MTTQQQIANDIIAAAKRYYPALSEEEKDVLWLLVEKMTGEGNGAGALGQGIISTTVMASQRWVATALRWEVVDVETGEIQPAKQRARRVLLQLEQKGVIRRVPYEKITWRNLQQALKRSASNGRMPTVYELVRSQVFDPLDFDPDEEDDD